MTKVIEYRLSWDNPKDAWRCAAFENAYGKDAWPKFTDAQWDEMLGEWHRIEVVFVGNERMGQYHGLKRWAETREQPIRNVKLEQREIVAPDEGWEPYGPRTTAPEGESR